MKNKEKDILKAKTNFHQFVKLFSPKIKDFAFHEEVIGVLMKDLDPQNLQIVRRSPNGITATHVIVDDLTQEVTEEDKKNALKFYDEPIEIWKDVPGWEGYYQASTLGRIRGVDRRIWNGKGYFTKKGVILKHCYDKRGYPRVCFRRGDKPKVFTVHRLIALTFIPNPENKRTVNHKDGIKTNNFLDNLEWNTYSENTRHAVKNGLHKGNPSWKGKYGKDHNKSKEVIQISLIDGFEINRFGSIKEAERKTNISSQSISNVCLGKRNKAGGFKWRHA